MAAWLVSVFALMAADDSRIILLETKDAKIEGGGRYDDTNGYKCIRDWKTTNVVARWNFDVPAKGSYRVLLTYACPRDGDGSEIEVNVGTQRANGLTESTGNWTTFKEFDLGPVLLRRPAATELSVKATRAAHGSVWDLRSVKLVREE